jgi:hypothetical protein
MPPMKTPECLALRKCSVTFLASCEAPYCCAHSRTNSAFVSVRKPEPVAIPNPVSPMYSPIVQENLESTLGEPRGGVGRLPGAPRSPRAPLRRQCVRSAPARRSASNGALMASGALAHSCSSSKLGSNPTLPPADARRRFARGIRPAISAGGVPPARLPAAAQGEDRDGQGTVPGICPKSSSRPRRPPAQSTPGGTRRKMTRPLRSRRANSAIDCSTSYRYNAV